MSSYTPCVSCHHSVNDFGSSGQDDDDDDFGTFIGAASIPESTASPTSSREVKWNADFSAVELGSQESSSEGPLGSDDKTRTLDLFVGQQSETGSPSTCAVEVGGGAETKRDSINGMGHLHCPQLIEQSTERSSVCVCLECDSHSHLRNKKKMCCETTDHLKHDQSSQGRPADIKNQEDDICEPNKCSDKAISYTRDNENLTPTEAKQCEREDDFGDFSTKESLVSVCNNSNFGQCTSKETTVSVTVNDNLEGIKPEGMTANDADHTVCNSLSIDCVDGDDFGEFSSKEAASQSANNDVFNDFSSKKAATSQLDDFADFSSHTYSSHSEAASKDFNTSANIGGTSFPQATSGTQSETEDNWLGSGAKGGNDGFGDFSGFAAAASDSDWANFAAPPSSSISAETEDECEEPDVDSCLSLSALASADTEKVHQSVFQKAAFHCFPGALLPTTTSRGCDRETKIACVKESGTKTHQEEQDASSLSLDLSTSTAGLVPLETDLKSGSGSLFGLTSLQQGHVVQIQSTGQEEGSGAGLWGSLRTHDDSPAMRFLWPASAINAHVLHTLGIDTQNMLRGHRKHSEPVYTTGLSLLENSSPRWRGADSSRRRGGGRAGEGWPSSLSSSLVSGPQGAAAARPR